MTTTRSRFDHIAVDQVAQTLPREAARELVAAVREEARHDVTEDLKGFTLSTQPDDDEGNRDGRMRLTYRCDSWTLVPQLEPLPGILRRAMKHRAACEQCRG